MVTVPRMAAMSLSRTFTLPSTRSRYTERAAAIGGCTVVSGVEGWSSRKGPGGAVVQRAQPSCTWGRVRLGQA